MLGDLNNDRIENILASQVLGRLGCTDGKQPYIFPLTYAYDGEYIYGQTNEGAKLTILRQNQNVCFEVDVVTDLRNWESVIVYGIFEELSEKTASAARDMLLNQVFPLMTTSTIHAHEHEANISTEESNRVKDVIFRIKIQRTTGRFEKG